MTNKIALIIGSSQRIGKDFALHLAQKDYFIWVHYRYSLKKAQDTLTQIQNLGGKGKLIQADLSSEKDISNLQQQIKITSNQIHLLIHNVGQYKVCPLSKETVSDFQTILKTNLVGSFSLTQIFLPLLKKTKGQIIFIGTSGLNASLASTYQTAYNISKMGQLILMRSYAQELGKDFIQVNMISPGHQSNSIDLPKDIAKHIPLQRSGLAKDLNQCLDFLLQNTYITGQNIEINGGFMLQFKDHLNK